MSKVKVRANSLFPSFEKKGGFEIGDNFIKKTPAARNIAGVNILISFTFLILTSQGGMIRGTR